MPNKAVVNTGSGAVAQDGGVVRIPAKTISHSG
jgi:hypothetical protein